MRSFNQFKQAIQQIKFAAQRFLPGFGITIKKNKLVEPFNESYVSKQKRNNRLLVSQDVKSVTKRKINKSEFNIFDNGRTINWN